MSWLPYAIAVLFMLLLMAVLTSLVIVIVLYILDLEYGPPRDLDDASGRAWKILPKGDPARTLLACERCGGTGTDPEYWLYSTNEAGPCVDCGGWGFDRRKRDLRRMRLLGIA